MRILLALVVLASLPLRAQDVPGVKSAFNRGEGVNGSVFAIALQPDGKILLGGAFSTVNGVPRQNLARLLPDGSLDRTFVEQVGMGANGPVYALAVDAQGGIIVGGDFTTVANISRTDVARLLPDGTVDPDFGGNGSDFGTNGSVRAVTVQPDGKIVIGGQFSIAWGKERFNAARINADGTLDAPLTPPSAQINGGIDALAVTANGTLAAGNFSIPNQQARSLTLFK